MLSLARLKAQTNIPFELCLTQIVELQLWKTSRAQKDKLEMGRKTEAVASLAIVIFTLTETYIFLIKAVLNYCTFLEK